MSQTRTLRSNPPPAERRKRPSLENSSAEILERCCGNIICEILVSILQTCHNEGLVDLWAQHRQGEMDGKIGKLLSVKFCHPECD
jgi:hypothetical protein